MSNEPTLKHVCIWSKQGWLPITAQEAYEQNGKVGVSSKCGLFMCDMCGKYVTLAVGQKRGPHFRHSLADEDKYCEERRMSSSGELDFDPSIHDLPIRIVNVSVRGFKLQLGMIRAPIADYGNDFYIEIQAKDRSNKKWKYTKERFNEDRITYVDLGNQPYERYFLKLSVESEELHRFWPKEISSVSPEGAVFNKRTGRMMPYDADVRINNEYYLLKPDSVIMRTGGSIQAKTIHNFVFNSESWTLYEVVATQLDATAAQFFLQFHCRLTENPVLLQPVWPLFSKGSFLYRYNSDSLHVMVRGNAASLHSFPSEGVEIFEQASDDHQVYKIISSGRQQLVTAGRSHILRFSYFWKEPLAQITKSPEISVTDIKGQTIQPGISSTIPPDKTLRITIPFDGTLVVRKHGIITYRQALKARETTSLQNVELNQTISIKVGLDEIWKREFAKEPRKISNSNNELYEAQLLEQLIKRGEPQIPIPHSLRNIQAKLHDYPQISAWIRQSLREGTINKQSYRLLQQAFRQEQTNK